MVFQEFRYLGQSLPACHHGSNRVLQHGAVVAHAPTHHVQGIQSAAQTHIKAGIGTSPDDRYQLGGRAVAVAKPNQPGRRMGGFQAQATERATVFGLRQFGLYEAPKPLGIDICIRDLVARLCRICCSCIFILIVSRNSVVAVVDKLQLAAGRPRANLLGPFTGATCGPCFVTLCAPSLVRVKTSKSPEMFSHLDFPLGAGQASATSGNTNHGVR
ncbi:hypothetical protein PG988_006471 [Apiospora saccharicola]